MTSKDPLLFVVQKGLSVNYPILLAFVLRDQFLQVVKLYMDSVLYLTEEH